AGVHATIPRQQRGTVSTPTVRQATEPPLPWPVSLVRIARRDATGGARHQTPDCRAHPRRAGQHGHGRPWAATASPTSAPHPIRWLPRFRPVARTARPRAAHAALTSLLQGKSLVCHHSCRHPPGSSHQRIRSTGVSTARRQDGTQLSFDELGTPLAETTFVVLDTETTGTSAGSDGITEIGAVKIRGGEILGEFATLI